MSVQKIENQFTTSEEQFKKNALSPESYIYVSPDTNLATSFYSADLTVGDGYSSVYSNSSKTLHSINSTLTLSPLSAIVIELSEDIWMPHNRFGILMPTGEAGLTHGLVFAPTKVEPNWKGKFKVRVFNSSNNKVTLEPGQKIASLILFSTSDMVHQAEVKRETEISQAPLSLVQKICRSYRDNPIHWSPAAMFVSALIGALAAILAG